MDSLKDDGWLYGFSVAGVGGIAADTQVEISPMAKINFLVGRNNHGKSTLLKAAQYWSRQGATELPGATRATLVPFLREDLVTMLRRCSVRGSVEVTARLESLVDLGGDRLAIWVDVSEPRATAEPTHMQVSKTLKRLLGVDGYSADAPTPLPHVAPRVVLIPAFRQMRLSEDAETPQLQTGEGLVPELSTWSLPRNPGSPSYVEAKRRWTKLTDFVRDVLEDPYAELEVAGASDLHVRLAQAGSMLHIDNLGDGIKQVLMIAAACVYFDKHLVLLEEPEIHLHAGLQRKLMRFLATRTDNQYLIATHSAHVLDLEGARIFHVTHDGRTTSAMPAVRASDVQQVCLDLGYMASDLLQANFTVWVEGPSDRVYWGRWLQLVAPELMEGVHFTIMSYGGYLIDGAHLLDEPDPATEDLIQLLRLGRRCVVIADSDKKHEDEELRPTLVRLRSEAHRAGSGELIVCEWVRTVENLLPRTKFRTVAIKLHPRAGRRLRTAQTSGSFDDPFLGMSRGSYSKVTIAKHVAPSLTEGDIGNELRLVLESLVQSIRQANGSARDSV